MAKKEKAVDLKPQKITDEQLEKIQAIISNINHWFIVFGCKKPLQIKIVIEITRCFTMECSMSLYHLIQ